MSSAGQQQQQVQQTNSPVSDLVVHSTTILTSKGDVGKYSNFDFNELQPGVKPVWAKDNQVGHA